MLFWIISFALAFFVAATLALALLRPPQTARPAVEYDLDVYRDQLKEVDRDLARGLLSKEDAERVRLEVSKRILAADAVRQAPQARETKAFARPIAVLLALTTVVGSAFVYLQIGAPGYGDLPLLSRLEQAETLRQTRPSQSNAEASLQGAVVEGAEMSEENMALVEELRTVVAQRPGDVEGLRLLARFEARMGDFQAAYTIQAQLIAVLGDAASAQDYADQAELLILAAGGYVSPEAETALQASMQRDPSNGTARYYFGLMMNQTGRPDITVRIWDQLLREGPEDALWIAAILSQIERTALLAGMPYQVPAIGSAPATLRGPTQEDIDAAQSLSPSERLVMIEGMVAGLGQRLATQGGPVEDWAQLISSLAILTRMDEARAILENAREVFEGDLRAKDILDRAADRSGLE